MTLLRQYNRFIREPIRTAEPARAPEGRGADGLLPGLLDAADGAEVQALLRKVRLLHELRGLLLNHVRHTIPAGTFSPRPRAAGRRPHRRLRRRGGLRRRARQMEHPPDRRASRRRRTGRRAPMRQVIAEDNPTLIGFDQDQGRPTWTMRSASPRLRSRPSGASARRTTSCSRTFRQPRTSAPGTTTENGPMTLLKLVETLCRPCRVSTPASCRRSVWPIKTAKGKK